MAFGSYVSNCGALWEWGMARGQQGRSAAPSDRTKFKDPGGSTAAAGVMFHRMARPHLFTH